MKIAALDMKMDAKIGSVDMKVESFRSAFCQIGAQGFLLLVFQLSLIPEVAEIDAGGDRY